MLTTTTRQIKEKGKGSQENFFAHILRRPLPGPALFTYYVGISLGTGEPIGLVTVQTGEVLRQWKRAAAIEEWLDSIFGGQLIGAMLIPASCPESAIVDMFVQLYELNEPSGHVPLNAEREALLASLDQYQGNTNGRDNGPTDT